MALQGAFQRAAEGMPCAGPVVLVGEQRLHVALLALVGERDHGVVLLLARAVLRAVERLLRLEALLAVEGLALQQERVLRGLLLELQGVVLLLLQVLRLQPERLLLGHGLQALDLRLCALADGVLLGLERVLLVLDALLKLAVRDFLLLLLDLLFQLLPVIVVLLVLEALLQAAQGVLILFLLLQALALLEELVQCLDLLVDGRDLRVALGLDGGDLRGDALLHGLLLALHELDAGLHDLVEHVLALGGVELLGREDLLQVRDVVPQVVAVQGLFRLVELLGEGRALLGGERVGLQHVLQGRGLLRGLLGGEVRQVLVEADLVLDEGALLVVELLLEPPALLRGELLLLQDAADGRDLLLGDVLAQGGVVLQFLELHLPAGLLGTSAPAASASGRDARHGDLGQGAVDQKARHGVAQLGEDGDQGDGFRLGLCGSGFELNDGVLRLYESVNGIARQDHGLLRLVFLLRNQVGDGVDVLLDVRIQPIIRLCQLFDGLVIRRRALCAVLNFFNVGAHLLCSALLLRGALGRVQRVLRVCQLLHGRGLLPRRRGGFLAVCGHLLLVGEGLLQECKVFLAAQLLLRGQLHGVLHGQLRGRVSFTQELVLQGVLLLEL